MKSLFIKLKNLPDYDQRSLDTVFATIAFGHFSVTRLRTEAEVLDFLTLKQKTEDQTPYWDTPWTIYREEMVFLATDADFTLGFQVDDTLQTQPSYNMRFGFYAIKVELDNPEKPSCSFYSRIATYGCPRFLID